MPPPNPYPEIRAVAVAAFNAEGKMLFGLRHDAGLWTCPGGHVDPGEPPARAAVRELYEEAGVTPTSLRLLGDGLIKLSDEKTYRIYCFRADVEGSPTGENDPDQECSEWHWVDVSLGRLPLEYDQALYHPNDVLLKLLGLQRGIIQNDAEQVESGDDTMKVILERVGSAPKPIEGHPGYVFLELSRAFPMLRNEAAPGDVEGLCMAINESGLAYVSFGDELNAPRHRYRVEAYSPDIEDPWRREAD